MFYKIAILKNFAIFTGKHPRWNLFLIKVKAHSLATLFKKDSNTGVLFKNTFFYTTPRVAAFLR